MHGRMHSMQRLLFVCTAWFAVCAMGHMSMQQVLRYILCTCWDLIPAQHARTVLVRTGPLHQHVHVRRECQPSMQASMRPAIQLSDSVLTGRDNPPWLCVLRMQVVLPYTPGPVS